MPEHILDPFIEECIKIKDFLNITDESVNFMEKVEAAVNFYHNIYIPGRTRKEGRQGASESSLND